MYACEFIEMATTKIFDLTFDLDPNFKGLQQGRMSIVPQSRSYTVSKKT